MITISERQCKSLPGITSLFISFPYHKEIISIIKTCSAYYYNSETKEWELPISCLSYLLDNLTFYSDIKLNILDSKKNLAQPKHITLEYKLKPFEHQIEGIEFGINNDCWLLLDAPGLGKTAQIIHIAEELQAQEGLEHCLIICGLNTLKKNWKEEIQKHSDLSCKILGERITKKGNTTYASVKERAEELKNPIEEFFIITNIETFRSDEVLEAYKKSKNNIGMIVVDEIHKCKSHQSQQGKNLLKLNKAKHRIGATGTLLLNDPLDAFVPLKWIGAEKSNFTNFKNFYCRFSTETKGMIVGFKNIDILKDQIDAYSLRRTKDLLNLPPKIIINEYIELNDDQQAFYQLIKDGVKKEIQEVTDKIDVSNMSILSMVTRLRQTTSYPEILTSENISSAKLDRAVSLAEEIISNGDKIVIFSTFKEPVYKLAEMLNEYNPLVCTGDSSDSEIYENKEKFQNDDRYKVFLGTWQKCGTGITLTAASYMIFLDTPWTYAVFEQACDRIYRIGTNKSVFIYKLICKDTVDEKVDKLLLSKQAISDYVIDDKISPDSIDELRNYIEELV